MINNKLVENGIFYLKNISLYTLPNGFKTEYSLDCNDSEITCLPDGLEVGGDLILGNAYIEELPLNMLVGGNIIFSQQNLEIPQDAIIGGQVISMDGSIIPFENPVDHTIVTETGDKVVFKNTKIFIHENDLPNDFYFPELTFYQNINKNKMNAVSYYENNQLYVLSCTNLKDALYQAQLKRAKVAGIDKYKNYDIDELRSVEELKEIYQVCTGACESGITRFLQEFNIDTSKKYSIRETRKLVLKVPFFACAKKIFLEYFNPNGKKEAE